MRWKLMTTSVLMFCYACSSEQNKTAFVPPPVPVLVAEVLEQDIPVYFESIGVLKPVVTVEVRPQVNGQLNEAYVSEGQLVKQGDRLFEIDPKTYEIRLQETEAQLIQDKAALESAKRKMERHQGLVQQDLISKQEWDELQAQVTKCQGQVQADQARVAAARLDVERCTIKSPVNGRVGKIQMHPGNIASTAQPSPLIVVTQVDPLLVDFTLTEREFIQLTSQHRSGQHPVEVAAFSSPDDRIAGTLTFFDSAFEAYTGLMPMRGSIPNPSMKYMPGQSVRVYMPIEVLSHAKVVPQKAVKINQKGPYVFIVKDDQSVELRQVTLGEERGEAVIVADGVAAGEKVVTDGHLRLAPGLKVEIKTESSQP